MFRVAPQARVLLDDAVGHALLAQGGGGGLAHPTATENEHRRGAAVPALAHPVAVRGQLRLRAGEQEHGARLDLGIRVGQAEPAPVPQADHVDAGGLAQTEVPDRLAHQGRAHGRGLGDDQVLEAADDVGAGVRAQGAPGERVAEHVHELEHMAAPGQAEDVHRVLQVGIGDNGHVRGDLAHRVDDAGVLHVVVQGHHQGRPVDLGAQVGGGVVQFADQHPEALVHQVERLLHLRDQDDVVVTVLAQPAHQGDGDRVPAGDEHVPGDLGRQGARHPRLVLGLEPGRVEELDEGERQHDQQEEDAADQHDDGEQPPQVAVEGDVAEPQGGHHRERPVDAGNRGEVAALVGHDHVEEKAEDRHQHRQEQGELGQGADVAARPPVLEQVEQLRGQKFHRRRLRVAGKNAPRGRVGDGAGRRRFIAGTGRGRAPAH